VANNVKFSHLRNVCWTAWIFWSLFCSVFQTQYIFNYNSY